MRGITKTVLAIACFATGVLSQAAAPPALNHSTPIANRFVVQYNDNISAADRKKHEDMIHAAAARRFEYRGIMKTFSIGTFQGYHVEIDSSAVKELQATTIIKNVLPDARISISSPIQHDHDLARRDDPALPPPGSDIRVVPTSTWGQSRLSHRDPAGSGFVYERGGSTAYVIDTGIRVTHDEFLTEDGNSTRAIWGENFLNGTADTDENGHGTHVSGTIGGRTLGIAPHTELIALKVFDANGGGAWSGVLAAIDWAVADAVAKNRTGRSVINMSLGGSKWQPIDDAVTAAVQAGVAVVVAAGNSGQLVSEVSPAGNPDAITVGAIYEDDSRAEWSNYGEGLDIFAPGWAIESAWIDSDTATREESGTSMACPHVAGLVAYLMEQYGPHTPAEMRDRVNTLATKDKVTGAGNGSANAIAYNGNDMFLLAD